MAFTEVHSRVNKRYNQQNFQSLQGHENLLVKYTQQKIAKVGWRPNSKGYSSHQNIFATGTWDELVGAQNVD